MAVPLATAVWFMLHGSGPALTVGAGGHLFNRAVFEQKLLDPDGAVTSRVQEMLPEVDLRNIYHWDLQRLLVARGVPVMTPQGRYNQELGRLIGGVAVEAALSDPFRFVLFSFQLAWRTLFADPGDQIHWFARSRDLPPDVSEALGSLLGADVIDRGRLENPRPLPTPVSAIQLRLSLDRIFSAVWAPICWLAVTGALCVPFSRHAWLAAGLVWVPASYLLACGFAEYFLPRYNVAVTPFITATATIPFGMFAAPRARRKRAEGPATRRRASISRDPRL
jgi:hypothetical protein